MKKFFFLLINLLSFALTAAPFAWRAEKQGEAYLVEVTVAKDHYLNADSIAFSGGKVLEKPIPAQQENHAVYPAGVWHWRVAGHGDLAVTYQGCRLAGNGEAPVCLLPGKFAFSAPAPTTDEVPRTIADAKIIKTFSGAMTKSEFLAWLDAGNARTAATLPAFGWLWFLAVLAGGFLLNLTPCVLPMIPVNLAIIGAGKGKPGAWRGLAYGAGMAVAYGVLGAIVVLTGARFGDLSGNAIFTFIVAGVFGFFALAMAGIVNFDLSRLATIRAQNLRGGKTFVAFLLGALAALLAGACVAPVVGGVIVTAAERYAAGETWGIFLPFLLGAGMALPWPLAGAGLAALPRPGKVMLFVKYGFAVILLLAAIRYCVAGVHLLKSDVSPQQEIAKLEAALARAKERQCPVVIDFWATWCTNCKDFDRNVLSDPAVKTALQKVEFVKFQAQKSDDAQVRAILSHFKLPGLPGSVMLFPR